jgi:hypothetical protein
MSILLHQARTHSGLGALASALTVPPSTTLGGDGQLTVPGVHLGGQVGSPAGHGMGGGIGGQLHGGHRVVPSGCTMQGPAGQTQGQFAFVVGSHGFGGGVGWG